MTLCFRASGVRMVNADYYTFPLCYTSQQELRVEVIHDGTFAVCDVSYALEMSYNCNRGVLLKFGLNVWCCGAWLLSDTTSRAKAIAGATCKTSRTRMQRLRTRVHRVESYQSATPMTQYANVVANVQTRACCSANTCLPLYKDVFDIIRTCV